MRKRVAELERISKDRYSAWQADYPGGVHIGTIGCAAIDADVRVKVARQCGHAVVAINGNNEIRLYAVPVTP